MEKSQCAIIYQVKEDLLRQHGFMSYDYNKQNGGINRDNYVKVAEVLVDGYDLEKDLEYIFTYGNTNPQYYADNPTARSISVSDIIELNDKYYYVDTIGFKEIKFDTLTEALEDETDEDVEDDIPIENIDMEDTNEEDTDNEETTKTLYDYLKDREGQQISVAEFNIVMQTIFSKLNEVFLTISDLYNADLDETQHLKIEDDEETTYDIAYDIIDVDEGIIEITEVSKY